jgi:hypothetical protein
VKNRYEFIDEDTVKIYLQVKDGVQLYALILALDFEVVSSLPGTWYAHDGARGRLYAEMKYQRKMVKMHRLIMEANGYDIRGRVVDHIDPERTLDNRRNNLRVATVAENNQNVSIRKDNKSGYRGVYYRADMGKWAAQVRINRKPHHLGFYETPEQAAEVAAKFRKEHLPFSWDALTEVNHSEQQSS